MINDFINYIKERGYFNQCTDENGLKKLNKNELIAYTGFDCTADSLHIGSLVQIMMLRSLQKFGLKPIILLGGGTTLIGDPSGKDKTRKILTKETIDANKAKFKKIFEKFLIFNNSLSSAIIVDNYEWLSKLNYINFLRDIGSQFSVNRMLGFDSIKLRLEREQNLSFLEFNYVIFQAYDFLQLNKTFNCNLQLGGSDQWGNIISGIDLVKKINGNKKIYGLTSPLITNSKGEKMGKTNQGAIWLTEDKLSAFDYWQFWRNTEDKDVIIFLKLFTELENSRIEKLADYKGSDLNEVKILLANEATKICHGEKKAKQAEINSKNIFLRNENLDSSISEKNKFIFKLNQKINLKELLVKLNLANSSSEAKRLIINGGVKLNEIKISDKNFLLTKSDFKEKKELKISVGKKKHGIIKAE